MPSNASEALGLAHVVVVGGTPAEWTHMSATDWLERLTAVSKGASVENVHWVTLMPLSGDELSDAERATFAQLMNSMKNLSVIRAAHGDRYVWRDLGGLSVIIDPASDGHARFARAIEHLRVDGVNPDDVDEAVLTRVLLDPATDEPDLVVILGAPDVLPDSLVWELAYSELVFLDLSWKELQASHLELAIDDFNRRHRRFGGLDS